MATHSFIARALAPLFAYFLLAFSTGAQTLPDVVKQGLSRDERVLGARHAVSASNADVELAASAANARISVEGGVGLGRQASLGSGSSKLFTPTVRLKKLIYDSGRTERGVELSQARVRQSKALLQVAREDVALQISEAYIEVARAKDVFFQTRQWVAALARIEAMTREIYNIDRGRAIDHAQAASRLRQAEAQLSAREAALSAAARGLNELVGSSIYIETPVSLVYALPESYFASAPKIDPAGHPRASAALAGAEAAQTQVELDRLYDRPRFEVDVFAGSGPDSRGRTKLIGNVGVQLLGSNLLLDGGAGRALVRVNEHKLSQAQAQVASVMREARTSVQRRLGAEEGRADRMASLKASVADAQGVRDMMLEQFKAGRRPLLDLLTQEGEIHQAALGFVQETYDGLLNKIHLFHSGGSLLFALNIALDRGVE